MHSIPFFGQRLSIILVLLTTGLRAFFGRIKKLPVRISVRTAKQCRFFFNFSSIFKGKKQQFDALQRGGGIYGSAHPSWFSDFETHFLGKFSSKFWFLSLISSRSRRNLASREERIQKFIHTAFFWPVEVGKILMHFLIVNMNELDLIRFLPYPRKIFF